MRPLEVEVRFVDGYRKEYKCPSCGFWISEMIMNIEINHECPNCAKRASLAAAWDPKYRNKLK